MFLKLFRKRKQHTDLELIALYRQTQDNAYVGELFERYTHLVYGVCMKYLRQQDESQDAVILIFEKLLVDLHKHQIDNFKHWLYRITQNHCLMQLRKQKTLSSKQEEYENFLQMDMESSPNLHLIDEEEHVEETHITKIEEAVSTLKQEQKNCIELFYLQEKSYQEIVEITGFSLNEVKSHLQNGKRNLKKQLGVLIVVLIGLWLMM